MNLRQARELAGRDGEEDAKHQRGDRDRGRCRAEGEQQTLGEIVPRQMRRGGAERCAQRHLAPARIDADEKQIGDICRGDEQDERHRAEKRP